MQNETALSIFKLSSFFERGFKWAKRVYGEHMTFLIANLFGRSFHLFSTLVALLLLLQMLQILSSLKTKEDRKKKH